MTKVPMLNQEQLTELERQSRQTPLAFVTALGLALVVGIGADFRSCAHQVSKPVSYPTVSAASFVVEKPAKFTGEPQTFVGKAIDPSGSISTITGNMVVLKGQAHYTWGGPSVPTLDWGFDTKESLSFAPDTQKMTLSRTAEGLSGASCTKTMTFDKSGESSATTTYYFWDKRMYTTAPVPADKDEYKYGWAKETISGALSRAMDLFNVVLEKNSLGADDDAEEARMCNLFAAKFSSMDPTSTGSVLSAITPTRDGVQQKDKYIEMSTGSATVRLYDTGVVENIETFDDGKKKIAVVVDPQGTVMATHEVRNTEGRNFSFTHILTDKGQVNGWGESSNARTGQDVVSVPLQYPMQSKEVMEAMGEVALENAIATKRFQMNKAANVTAKLPDVTGPSHD